MFISLSLDCLRAAWERRRRRQALALIRREMAALGWPVDHMTDEEIEQAMAEMARRLDEVGMAAEEAAAGFERMACALQHVEDSLLSFAPFTHAL